MVHEDLEFLISQYIDGTISPADRTLLEARLSHDEDARLLVREYRKLEGMIQATVPSVSLFDFESLTARINDAIDEHESASTRHFRIPWVGRGIGLALAASVIIIIGVWFNTHPETNAPPRMAAGVGVVEVALLQPEPMPAGPVIQEIQIGGPPAGGSASIAISEAIVHQSNTLFIAKADDGAQDTFRVLY